MASSESAKPLEAADDDRPSSSVRAIARRIASARCASEATGRALWQARGDLAEEIVEGPDPAAQQPAAPLEQVALDPLDVRTIRHDEPRIVLERIEIALQKARDLTGVSRPDDERQRHPPIVVPPSDALSYAAGRVRAKSAKSRAGVR